ncbi:MAG: hypothetical protein HZB57_00530, partial [Gammaproteobacteria bacterium]|nr:hypothetical protein [Gammaproteobacteria bacterium]
MQSYAENLSLVKSDPLSTGALRRADDLADRLLRVTQSLQTTLEIPALLEIFYLQSNANVPLDGLEYVNEPLNFEYRIGSRSRHTCTYNLRLGDIGMGGLLFR